MGTPAHLPSIIAIDGPASSGKSTLGKGMADRLGYLFFDTGVMYRAITWLALSQGVPVQDGAALTELACRSDIDIRPPSVADRRNCDILVDGTDVTWSIREQQVESQVSAVSAVPGVRQALTLQQQRIGQRGQVVMVGRDIGTVVMPQAELKIFLVASAEERARRRYEELHQRGEEADYSQILAGLRRRDEIDSSRQVAPLRPADDAKLIDSDGLDAAQVLEYAMRLVYQAAEQDP